MNSSFEIGHNDKCFRLNSRRSYEYNDSSITITGTTNYRTLYDFMAFYFSFNIVIWIVTAFSSLTFTASTKDLLLAACSMHTIQYRAMNTTHKMHRDAKYLSRVQITRMDVDDSSCQPTSLDTVPEQIT